VCHSARCCCDSINPFTSTRSYVEAAGYV